MFTLLVILYAAVVSTVALEDYGIPNWTCDKQVMRRSAKVPRSVHSLRFADIDVIAAIGDSLTAGNGAGAVSANDTQALKTEYRGLAFSAGGELDLDRHVTLANILKKFNPKLYGFSVGSGKANNTKAAQFNAAVPGSRSVNLTAQAKDLVKRFKKNSKVNVKNDWKLIHIFIGGNDICAWCDYPEYHSADLFGKRIFEAVKYLKDNLPRTIVVITGMMDITVLRQLGEKNFQCKTMHSGLCPCVQSQNVTTEELRGICKKYMRKQDELQYSPIFDTSDDFTVVVQPFFENNSRVPLLSDGNVDLSHFAPDCFHFSAKGHAEVAKSLWNNMQQPILSKSTDSDLTNLATPLSCPDESCPFIRTTKNSVDCGLYMTK